jgi:hypothetical protein
MLLHRAKLRRTNKRIKVLFRETWRDLDLQANGLYHAGDVVMVDTFDDTDTLGGQVARLAESQYVDAGTCPDRSEKNLEWARGTCVRRLIGSNSEVPKVGVYLGTTREIDDHFHEVHLHTKKIGIENALSIDDSISQKWHLNQHFLAVDD